MNCQSQPRKKFPQWREFWPIKVKYLGACARTQTRIIVVSDRQECADNSFIDALSLKADIGHALDERVDAALRLRICWISRPRPPDKGFDFAIRSSIRRDE